MTTQFTFKLEDQPGSLATVAEALANAGINIDGIAGVSANGQGFINMLTNNPESAENALNSAGIPYNMQDVLIINLEDKPGQVSMLTRALANEGINLNTLYVTMKGHQILGTDNMARTKEIASGLGIFG